MPSKSRVAGFALGSYPGRLAGSRPVYVPPPIPILGTNPEEVIFGDGGPTPLVGPLDFTSLTTGVAPQPPPIVQFYVTAVVTKDATPGGVSLIMFIDGVPFTLGAPFVIFGANQTQQLVWNRSVTLTRVGAHTIQLFIQGQSGLGGGDVLANQASLLINYT